MELIGKLQSNETSNIVIRFSASKDIYAKFSDQYIHIINSNKILNRIKIITKIQKR